MCAVGPKADLGRRLNPCKRSLDERSGHLAWRRRSSAISSSPRPRRSKRAPRSTISPMPCGHRELGRRVRACLSVRPGSTALTSAHAGVRKFRPHLRTLFAAACTGEVWFDVGEPDIIGPAVSIRFYVMGASMTAAIPVQWCGRRSA